jgi:hypothetical protein
MDFNARLMECKHRIDMLTQDILEKIKSNELSEVSSLFMQRFDLLTEIISYVVTNEDKKILLSYLTHFQRRDQAIMLSLSKEQEIIKSTLLNIKHLKTYVNL